MNCSTFLQQIMAHEDIDAAKHNPVLVTLSGGADSVALLRVLLEAGCSCHAVHCNFHLRGEESMRDERFVRDLCQRLDVPLTVEDFNVPAYQTEHGGSVEMACRELRYAWFEEERQRHGCHLIAIAHHADDQIETFFLNLMRGTGVRGLAGMQSLSGHLWRPLLHVTRQDILDYLQSIGQDYVTDSTNAHNTYRRNRLRNVVLPTLYQQFPQAQARIGDTMQNLRRDSDLLTQLTQIILPDLWHINIDTICALPDAATLLYHRIRHLGFSREMCVNAIKAAQQHSSGKQLVGTRGYALYVNRQTLDIEPIEQECEIEIPIDITVDTISPVHISISLNNAPFSPHMCDGKTTVAFNVQLLQCQRIVLRHWRQGDRIKPFGMNGSKLVSDLFADLKLNHAQKCATWLMEADGEIIWVLNHRASSLYPVTKESQDYILLSLSDNKH